MSEQIEIGEPVKVEPIESYWISVEEKLDDETIVGADFVLMIFDNVESREITLFMKRTKSHIDFQGVHRFVLEPIFSASEENAIDFLEKILSLIKKSYKLKK